MKKLLTLSFLAFALAFTGCNKDNDLDEILASIEDNQVSFNGKVYNVDGYINRDKDDSGEEFWIVDLFCGDNDGYVSGILQGKFFGKDVDLVKVSVSEMMFCVNVGGGASASSNEDYGFILQKQDGKLESCLGMNPSDQKLAEGSCFKSGKITSKVNGGNAVITVSGVLSDGKSLAVKLNRPFEDR